MIGDGIFDDLDEFLLRRSGTNLVSMKQLHHQASKSFEGTGYADGRTDPDEYILGCLDVDLKLAGLVDR
jgi:hypothetical protein